MMISRFLALIFGVPFLMLLGPVDGSFQDVRTVGLTAKRTNPLTSGDNAIAEFDSVLTNSGDSFNPSTGIFTCIIPGSYLFWLDFHASSPASTVNTEIELVHNDDAIITVVRKDGYAESATGSTILDLKYDDKVFLRLKDGTQLESNVMKPLTFTAFIISRY